MDIVVALLRLILKVQAVFSCDNGSKVALWSYYVGSNQQLSFEGIKMSSCDNVLIARLGYFNDQNINLIAGCIRGTLKNKQ
jgi:hypothetical protein